jgi:hypothetical protein
MKMYDKYLNRTHSYMALRKAVGWIGILLPFTLMFGIFLIFKEDIIQPSISSYYYTGMGDVFVGSICAVGLFMFFYTGYDKRDNRAGNLAGFFAVALALFPTTEAGPLDSIGVVHLVTASAFFLVLAYFSLFLFTIKSDHSSDEKRTRNKVYRICGIIMLVCLVAMLAYFIFIEERYPIPGFVFWGETLALLAFGVSWLTKGGSIYPDKQKT